MAAARRLEPAWWGAVEALPAPERAATKHRLRVALGPLRLRWTPWWPTPKQEALLRIAAPEVGYGGAAGGGKSIALLMWAAQYADVPGYAALLLRRTYGELALPGALMNIAERWWRGSTARWNQGERTWTFPSGATITFGYLKREADLGRYQGAAFHRVGFDEGTAFTKAMHEFMHSRTRRPEGDAQGKSPDGLSAADVPIQLAWASNPGGPGHEYLRERFVDAELRDPTTRFLPARLEDNPHLDRDRYIKSLMHLSPVLRRRLLDGDWSAREAGMVYLADWFSIVEPGFHGKAARYWDLAATDAGGDYSTGLRLEHDWSTGAWTVTDVVHGQWGPAELERQVRRTAELDGRGVVVGMEQEPGASGKIVVDHYARHVLAGFAVRGVRPTGDKVTRASVPAAAAANGLMRIVRAPWNRAFLSQLEAFPDDDHDDIVDALSGAHELLSTGGGPVETATPTGRAGR